MVECAATCCAETWRRCAVLSQALAVAAGVHCLATILIPNELEVAWLLCYDARGTRPPFWFRTHKPLMLCTGARTLSLWQWRAFSLSTARACSNPPGDPVCFVLTALARFAQCTGSLWCNSSWALLDDALTAMTGMTATAIDLALWNLIAESRV